MVREDDVSKDLGLRRLALLETYPIRTLADLHEWRRLRKWAIDEGLLEEYRDQDYFRRRDEITKNQLVPENPRSIFSRFWNCLFPKQ